MSRKKKQFKFSDWVKKGLVIGITAAILLVGGLVLAFPDGVQKTFNIAGDYIEAPANIVEETFGGIVHEAEDFTEGFKIDDNWVYDGDGNKYYNISVNCSTDNRATTTADDAGTGISTAGFAAMTICYWQNPLENYDLVVEDLYLDVFETFSIASTMSVASTTSGGTMAQYPYQQWRNATSGTLTLIASTTVATTKDSEATGFIGIENYPGTVIDLFGGKADATNAFVTSTAFVLDADDYVVVSWHPYGATSTRSFDALGGFTGDVWLHGKAYLREGE